MSSISVQFIDEYALGREALSTLHAIQRLESRLSALEHPEPDKQPSVEKPAETEREWIRLNLTTEVWARKNDGGITRISFGTAINRNHLYTHIMPYHPGEQKPEPPKGDK
jgi:hypothetical protein